MQDRSSQPHLSQEELLASLYVEGEHSDHLLACAECRERREAAQTQRNIIESSYQPDDEVSFEFLAAQRRDIYTKIDTHARTAWLQNVRRWAAATVMAGIIAGAVVVTQHDRQPAVSNNISDAQLAADVSQFASDSDAQPAAPLHALFQE